MATMSEIAKACGLSTATVSYVMNNAPNKVKASTRRRVLDVARTLKYTPNALARGLNGKAVNAIGVVVIDPVPSPLDHPYYRPILSGILDEAATLRQSMNFYNGFEWPADEDPVPYFCDGRCDGLLIFFPKIGNRIVDALKAQLIPFAIIGEGACDHTVSSIDIDSIAAARAVTRLIISKGHRRIAHLEGDAGLQSAIDRLQGYRDALDESGIEFDPSLVVPGGYSGPTGYDRVYKMFSRGGNLPTAIFAANDSVAYYAIDALRDLGIRVPQDVSVAGLDGAESRRDIHLTLTTANQHLRNLGRTAAKVIIEQVKSGDKSVKKVVQPFELIVGDSVATAV